MHGKSREPLLMICRKAAALCGTDISGYTPVLDVCCNFKGHFGPVKSVIDKFCGSFNAKVTCVVVHGLQNHGSVEQVRQAGSQRCLLVILYRRPHFILSLDSSCCSRVTLGFECLGAETHWSILTCSFTTQMTESELWACNSSLRLSCSGRLTFILVR